MKDSKAIRKAIKDLFGLVEPLDLKTTKTEVSMLRTIGLSDDDLRAELRKRRLNVVGEIPPGDREKFLRDLQFRLIKTLTIV